VLRMTPEWSCHPETFGYAQDKLREGSAFKLTHYPLGAVPLGATSFAPTLRPAAGMSFTAPMAETKTSLPCYRLVMMTTPANMRIAPKTTRWLTVSTLRKKTTLSSTVNSGVVFSSGIITDNSPLAKATKLRT
jgi:hypothetical protein